MVQLTNGGESMIWFVLAIVFIDVVFAVFALSRINTKSKPIARLEKFFDWEEHKKERLERRFTRAGFQNITRSIGGFIVRLFLLERLRKRIEKDLERADIPVRGEEMLLFLLSSTAVLYFLTVFFTKRILLSLLIVPLGLILARLVVVAKIKKRLENVNEQLGDALDMMASSLRAGYSFNQAMETVSREMPKPINMEFKQVVRETSYGVSMDEALDKMLERVQLDDLELVVTAVKIQRQIGGNLAEILDNISGTIRQRVQLKGEVRALTAQGRLSGVIASSAPILLGVFMAINSPDHIKLLFTDSLGQKLLVIGIIGQLLGFIFIKRIIDIKF